MGKLTREKLESSCMAWRTNWGALILAAAFVAAFFWLTTRQYATFHKRAPDLAMFDQAIWNTLQGRFMFSTIKYRSIFANHFSPYMVLLCPLYLIWSDVRILYFVQTAGLAVAGLFLHRIVRSKHPGIAHWFLLAFYLNPALHQVALHELRRVILAVPFLAMAMYALYAKKRSLMVLGLFFALLCKENIGLIVSMVGVHLVLFERDWKWGVPLIVGGATWMAAMMLWIIPAFNPPGDPSGYRLVSYFGLWGDSFESIIINMLSAPLTLVQVMFDKEALQALWRVFLPVAIILPLLAPDWVLIGLPSVGYMLMSNFAPMHQLEDWYMASVIPILFAAVAVGLARRSGRRARWLTMLLLAATAIGYGLFSFAPLGGRYDPSYYTLTEHHRLAAKVVAAVPAEARVAAQDPYISHLAHREHIYLYPLIPPEEKESIDYFLLDRNMHAYPFQGGEIGYEIDNLVADPSLVVEMEGNGIYLLGNHGDPLPSFPVDRVAEGSMRLDRVEVAVLDQGGFFRTVEQEPVELRPGQEVRVSLYWQALAAPSGERTVSVRIADAAGALVAQHDMQPSDGARPTSWWEPGWEFRDVYYLTVSPEAPSGPGSLDIVLYDTYTLDRVPFDDGVEVVSLCTVTLIP
jgi:uncharacterized membrane protein